MANHKCCLCIPRNIGVRLIFLYMCVAIVLFSTMTSKWGSKATLPMAPVLLMISLNVITMGWVFFVPGQETVKGRYAVYWMWTYLILFTWQIYWQLLLWTDLFGTTVQEWKCEEKFPIASKDFKNCLEPAKMEEVYNGIPAIIIDIILAWELWRYYRDAKEEEDEDQ